MTWNPVGRSNRDGVDLVLPVVHCRSSIIVLPDRTHGGAARSGSVGFRESAIIATNWKDVYACCINEATSRIWCALRTSDPAVESQNGTVYLHRSWWHSHH